MTERERVISLDTETTGLDSATDRIVEIGAVELIGNVCTGRNFHVYVSPGRVKVHPEALRVHGITDEFLADKPSFRAVHQEFMDFIGDSPLVIHNAPFDMGFINKELERINKPALPNAIVDTLAIARSGNPGGRNTLDALCAKYGVDNSGRDLHGALIDADLLGQVYIKMMGLDRLALFAAADATDEIVHAVSDARRAPRAPRSIGNATTSEIEIHAAFISADVPTPVWDKFLG